MAWVERRKQKQMLGCETQGWWTHLMELGEEAEAKVRHLGCHSHSHLSQGEAEAMRERHLDPRQACHHAGAMRL